jgi:hypothetical protein
MRAPLWARSRDTELAPAWVLDSASVLALVVEMWARVKAPAMVLLWVKVWVQTSDQSWVTLSVQSWVQTWATAKVPTWDLQLGQRLHQVASVWVLTSGQLLERSWASA